MGAIIYVLREPPSEGMAAGLVHQHFGFGAGSLLPWLNYPAHGDHHQRGNQGRDGGGEKQAPGCPVSTDQLAGQNRQNWASVNQGRPPKPEPIPVDRRSVG